MSRAQVEAEVCEGTGFCVALAGDLFRLEEANAAAVDRELTPDEAELAQEAADMCPTRAIELLD